MNFTLNEIKINFVKKIVKLIDNNNNFVIITHERPDGDAIGSATAFAILLKFFKKNVLIYVKDKFPENYLIENIKEEINIVVNSDFTPEKYFYSNNFVIIMFDSSSFERTGFSSSKKYNISLNIDHHISNVMEANINIVLPDISSTAELVFEITKNIANFDNRFKQILQNRLFLEELLMGILFDTYYFHNINTGYKTLLNVAEMVKKGARLHFVKDKLLKTKNPEVFKLWGKVLERLKIFNNGDAILAYMKFNEIDKFQSQDIPTEGFINHLMSIKNSKIVVFIREIDKNVIRGSIRSTNNKALEFAQYFNGGGHKNAAGFTIFNSFDKALETVENKLIEFIKN